MKLIFKITFYSYETEKQCVRFAKTLAVAEHFVFQMKKAKQGTNFKITPLKIA